MPATRDGLQRLLEFFLYGIGEKCAYRKVCTIRHDEGLPVYCIRALAFTEMLRIRLEADDHWKLDGFGLPCRVRLARNPWR